MTQQERNELLASNDKYCHDNDIWHLHPFEGYCYNCRYDLVEHYGDRYVQACPTGCPKCNRSYCD